MIKFAKETLERYEAFKQTKTGTTLTLVWSILQTIVVLGLVYLVDLDNAYKLALLLVLI